MSSADPDALRAALLAELVDHPEGLSLPRLCKRLGVRMSTLSRALAWLGDMPIAGLPAEGLVQVVADGDRQAARLTERGRRLAADQPRSRSR